MPWDEAKVPEVVALVLLNEVVAVMNELPFVKMQGIGNDFVVIDDFVCRQADSPVTPELTRRICDRRFGVGADQILWLRKPLDPAADVRMEILNADGTVAEMCGNGIRAVGMFLAKRFSGGKSRGGARAAEFVVETLAGNKRIWLEGGEVAVDMGVPVLGGGFPLEGEVIRPIVNGAELRFFEVNVGNPHAVIFIEESPADFPVESFGPVIEKAPRFPNRTNVEFVRVVDDHSIDVRVWERGAGLTLACGTGACASAVAALATGRVKRPVSVRLPGGKLTIDWAGGKSPVIMKGPAEEVFSGSYRLS